MPSPDTASAPAPSPTAVLQADSTTQSALSCRPRILLTVKSPLPSTWATEGALRASARRGGARRGARRGRAPRARPPPPRRGGGKPPPPGVVEPGGAHRHLVG